MAKARTTIAPKADVRTRLLKAGYSLFATAGFNATGVKEIVDLAGVPKGSFYAYFPSKEALGCAVIDRYWLAGADDVLALQDPGRPPLERLKAHFAGISASLVQSDFLVGCLLGRFSGEVAGQSELMRQHLSSRLSDWSRCLAVVVREIAQEDGLAEGVDPDEAADYLLNAWEGAMLRARAERSEDPLEAFQKVAFSTLFRAKQAGRPGS
jgi:TetR/AcrR family transcriptional repressor of nem operon